MRDIVQVSCAIVNPYSGVTVGGSKIEPTVPDVDLDSGFILDLLGYLYDTGELFMDGEMFA